MKRKLLSVLLTCILAFGIAIPVTQIGAAPGEVIGLRDQYSKTVNNGDGSYSRITYLGSIHYEDDAGNFQPINTTIIASNKPNWDWEVTTGHWKLFVNNDTTVGVKKGNNWIGTRLHGIAYYDASTKDYVILQTANSVTPVVSGNKITWYDILYGVDYVLHYTADSLKEDVIIHQEARDLLSSAGHRPSDYGYLASNTYLVPIFECDWSESLPMKLRWDIIDTEMTVSPDNIDTKKAIHFEADTPDPYWETKLVSFLPIYMATSVNPINPQDPEEDWEYAECVMKKRLVKKYDKHWLLTGVPVLELNSMPEGSIIFDPTETLRPDGAGDEENILYDTSGVGNHHLDVDDVTPDGLTTNVNTNVAAYLRDLYNVANSGVGSGVINHIKVYACCYASYPVHQGSLKIAIKSTNAHESAVKTATEGSWALFSEQWDTNPDNAHAWTWEEIDDLQIGISMREASEGYHTPTYCTQVYVVVDYALEAPTVTTQAVSDITGTTATGNGSITNTGEDDTCDKRGIVYDTSSHSDPGNTAPAVSAYANYEEETDSFGTGAFTRNLTGLDPGQIYYVRAYAHNVSGGYGYSEEISFYALIVAPAITTDAATYVAKTTARLNSTVDSDGGQACDVRFGYDIVTRAVFTDYDTITDWVNNTYTTGQHPWVDIEGLTPTDEYFYRVQIKNDHSTVDPDDEKSFTTLTDLVAPTNLKAYPGSTSVGLTWTKGVATTNTMIRYSETGYPANQTEGTHSYTGTLASHTITGLTAGHTYYIVAIGNSAAEYTATVEVMATTTAAEAAVTYPGAPDEPTGLFQDPDPAQIPNFPGYDVFNPIAEDLNIPLGTMWMYIILFGVGFLAFVFYTISHNLLVVMVVTVVGITWGSLIGILPLWWIFITVILGLGLYQFQQRGT